MKHRFQVSWMTFLILIFVLSSCTRDDPDNLWEEGDPGAPTNDSLVEITEIQSDRGSIPVVYRLQFDGDDARDVELSYKGACAGDSGWTGAFIEGEIEDLLPGTHTLIWHSWETEAGCDGEVTLRITTNKGESGESNSFKLDNTVPGQDGFYQTPLEDQGIGDLELEVYDQALEALLADESVDFVAARIGEYYEVHAARGSVVFHRIQSNTGYQYVVDEIQGTNPIAVQDPAAFASYEAELYAGSNPNNVTIPEVGYLEGDERLSFIEPENDSYPFAYERIAAYFDHPDSADFMINWKGYSHAHTGYTGTHHSLNITQSRSPLIFWGAGVQNGGGAGLHTRQVDIAPTVAELLGFEKTYGVDERGIWSHNVYLTWQDGHVIKEVLNGEKSEVVIVLVSDGLNHNEVLRQIQYRPHKVPDLVKLITEGAMIENGSTTNWPSVTYPSHNTIGAGIYSGHHGVVDNEYYFRDQEKKAAPISQLVMTDKYFNPIGPGETLHQAVERNFGPWNVFDGGAYTASFLDPSVRGALTADIEFRDATGQIPFPPFGLEQPYGLPPVDLRFIETLSVLGEQALVQLAFTQLYHLFGLAPDVTPKYVILNIMTSDGAGHAFGPHGDDMDFVMGRISDLVGALFLWLKEWGLEDQATIILTSDHGMQIGDPSRYHWPIDTLRDAGIQIADETYLGVYLKVPVFKFDRPGLPLGKTGTIEISVTDEDNGLPVSGALLELTDGVSSTSAITDENGLATIAFEALTDVQVTVTHPEFTSRTHLLRAMEEFDE